MSDTTFPATSFAPRAQETLADRTRRLARELVNTCYLPQGYQTAQLMAMEANAYHTLNPYPYWAFHDWKKEERGPIPRCMPFVRGIVRKGAKWLFGKPLQINCPNNESLQEALRTAWQSNRMPTRMVSAAEKGGVQGGVVLKFSYDETAEVPIAFQILSAIDDVRLYYDPHDKDCLLMARVQYPFFDASTGRWWMYREEWTAEQEIHYRPEQIEFIPQTINTTQGLLIYGSVPILSNQRGSPDSYTQWVITEETNNPFGVIPMLRIKNVDYDEVWGMGDLWSGYTGGMFRVIDRINLTRHLEDKSNQLDSGHTVVYIDAADEQDVIDRPLAPEQPLSIKSDVGADGAVKQAQVIPLEARGTMRPFMAEHARDLKKEILDAVGSVEIDQGEITNKGNLTTAVLTQLYAPLIGSTEEKRKTYGEDGVCKFLELVSVGLSNFGVKEFKGVSPDTDTCDCQIVWPDYFDLQDADKLARVTRMQTEESAGYTTHDRAVNVIAQMEGVEDIEALLTEVDAEMQKKQADAVKNAADMATATGQAAFNSPVKQIGANPSPPS